MKAMVLEKPMQSLVAREVAVPEPAPGEVRVRVEACGVCRTDLHVVDGELTEPKLPLIPGHQVVGIVDQLGQAVTTLQLGDRVGVPWLGGVCGHCQYCLSAQENLCDDAIYTGYQRDGGFAEWCVADARFIFPIPEGYSAVQAAPLLCAGLIGYRAWRMVGEAKHVGFYGFGAAAHLLTQVACYEGRKVYAFTRSHDRTAQELAKDLGATWVGNSQEQPKRQLDAAIIFAPVGSLIPIALKAVRKGGVVVCAGIHMSPIPSFPYELLWGERVVRSVANLTRRDGEEFLALAPRIPIQTHVTTYPLEKTNEALNDLRAGSLTGAAVIVIDKTLTTEHARGVRGQPNHRGHRANTEKKND